MTAPRICSAVIPGGALACRCGLRVVSPLRSGIFGSTSKASAPKSTVLAALPASLPSCFEVFRSQRGTFVAKSSLLTQQVVEMPVIQDHSSFANYQQAAVTHIDLGTYCVQLFQYQATRCANTTAAACRLICTF